MPYADVQGVEPNLLAVDVYTPELDAMCEPAPIAVFVHGGGFRLGDKDNKIDDKVDLFTGMGWVLASVNYRLSDPDLADPVRYPTHEQDVAAAVAWLQLHAADYRADPTRMLLIGHSSGAFIVSLLSTNTAFLAAAGVDITHIRCTAALDTEYDVVAQIAQGGMQEELYRNAFGNDTVAWTDGSPITHTKPGIARPAFLIVTQGPSRRTEQAQRFADALIAGGTPATVLDVNPLEHDEINTAIGDPNDTSVTPALVLFLQSCV